MGKFSGGLGEGSKSILYALITPKKILFFSKKDTTLYFSRKRSKNILFFPPRGRGLSSHQLPGLTGFLIRLQTNLAMFPFKTIILRCSHGHNVSIQEVTSLHHPKFFLGVQCQFEAYKKQISISFRTNFASFYKNFCMIGFGLGFV